MIVFGQTIYDASRYRGHKAEGPEKIVVFFDAPREVVTIEGRASVQAALEEVGECFDIANASSNSWMWESMR